MICSNCGSVVEEETVFCPNCGNRIKQPMETQEQDNAESALVKRFDKSKLLAVGIVLAVVVFTVGLVIGLVLSKKSQKENSLVGEWHSQDLIDLGDILEEKLEDQGINTMIAGALGSMLESMEGKLNLTMTENGNLYIGTGDLLLSIGEFTYENIGDGTILLVWRGDISVLGIGTQVAIAYRSEYELDGDILHLDLFGFDATFVRYTR